MSAHPSSAARRAASVCVGALAAFVGQLHRQAT